LVHTGLGLGASVGRAAAPATVRLGFARARARERRGLFTDAGIAPGAREHVLDSLFGFAVALGVGERLLRWDLPLPSAARAYAERLIPDTRPTLVINPCSRHVRRNWRPARFAALAEHAAGRLRMRVILAGGPSELERRTGAEIERACPASLINQLGKDTLPDPLALLSRATV